MSSWQKFKQSFVEEGQNNYHTSSSWQKYKKSSIKEEEEERQRRLKVQNERRENSRQQAMERMQESEREKQKRINAIKTETAELQAKRDEENRKKKEEQEAIKSQIEQQYSKELEEIKKKVSISPTEQAQKKEDHNNLSLADKIKTSQSTLSEEDKTLKPTENLGKLTKVTSEALKAEQKAKKRAEEVNRAIEEKDYLRASGFVLEGFAEGARSKIAGLGKAGMGIMALGTSELEKNIPEGRVKNFLEVATNKLLDNQQYLKDNTSYYQKALSNTDSNTVKTSGQISNVAGEMLTLANVSGVSNALMAISAGGHSMAETLNDDRSNLGKSVITGAAKGGIAYYANKIIGGDFISKGIADKLAVKGISKITANKTAQNILWKAYQIGGEQLEESLEDDVGILIDKVVNGNSLPTSKEYWAQKGETAKITGISTLVLHALGLGGGDFDTALRETQISDLNNEINKASNQEQTEEVQNELKWKQKQLDALTLPTANINHVTQLQSPKSEQELINNAGIQEQNMIPMETATNEASYTRQQELLNSIENNQETLYNNNESESGINGKQQAIESNDQRGTTGLFTQHEGRTTDERGYQIINEEQIARTKQEEIEYIRQPENQINNLNNNQSRIKEAFESKGAKVVFYSLQSNKGGYYDNGTLYINENGVNDFEQLDEAIHEYAHYLIRDNVDFNSKITSIAEEIVRSEENGNSEAIRNYIMNRDENINIEDVDRIYQTVVEEILADYAIDVKKDIDFSVSNQYGIDSNILNKYKNMLKDYLPDIELQNSSKSSFSMQQNVDSNIKNNVLPTAKNNVAPSMENNVQKYNRYKQDIIKNKETQVNNLISFKNETSRNIDQKIAEKQVLLNSKKNQNTKTASILKSQIENLKAQKQNIESLYNEKIDKTNSKISKEKIEFETRNKMKQEAREAIKAEVSPLIQDLTKYKDKKTGWKYNRETAQRNIDDIVSDKKLAESIKETIFNPVQKHQAEKTREINSIFEKINTLKLDKTKKYYYIPKGEIKGIKIDEATLAQLLIEKKITDKDLKNYAIDDAEIKKIHKTADTFTEILEDLYTKMNEEQVKYGYSPIGKIENYFPHFSENKPDNMLGKIASYFGIDLSDQSLPTEIAGLTDRFKPGETWNANIQKRRTNKTDYDALTALERYVIGATEIIHTTEDIQKIREYAKQIRYQYSDESIQSEIDKILNNKDITQEAKDSSVEGIFKNIENGLPNFVTWLDDYANTLAGKKAFSDRNMERNIGRNMYKSMSGIESRIASNTIGGNVSVSLTNVAPLFQAMGTTKVNYLLTGMLQTTKNNIIGIFNGGKDISFANNSTFLTNRFGTDSISRKTFSQKFSDKASALMNMIDEFTAESIVRGKYLENLDSGMTEEQALKSADEYAGKIMADRSKGALPLVFNTKNPLSKLVTMFQVEPNNIVSNYFKDMPRDAKSNAQLTKQITKLMVSSYVFNALAMAIRGGNEVLPDPIRWVSYLIQMVTGNDDEKEKAKDDLVESLVGSTPFISNLAGFVGMEDIGRVPISNAMPDLTKISSLFDPDADSKYKKETSLKEFSKPFLYLGLPTGGAQLKKTAEGIATVSARGSYKTNKKGETQLQFPVENPNVLDYAKAGVLGKYSLSDSKAYADRGYKALSGKQTKTYQESGIAFKEYTDYIDSKLNKNEDKINYINNTKWNTEQKWGIYKNDILSDNERKDGGSQASDAEYIIKNGTSKLDYINSYNKLQKNNLDIPTKEDYIKMKEKGVSLKGYTDYKTKVKKETESKRNSGELKSEQDLKDEDKLRILIDSNYSQKETQGIYESQILSSTDKKYPIIKEIFTENGLNITKYLQYKSQKFSSDKRDDGTIDGKSISGSKKEKVWNYIENMDITYTQKLILYGLEYTPSDREQTQIINYINSLPNKTSKEKLEILKQFKGFTIYKNGTFKY